MGLALLDDAGTSSDTIARSSPRPERPVPCTGARCSRQPTPASTAPLLDLQRTGNWAILSASTQVAIAERDSSPHDDRILLPMADGTSIYHPPRSARRLFSISDPKIVPCRLLEAVSWILASPHHDRDCTAGDLSGMPVR